ncbi:MAG: YeeE/YedE family protein [Rubrivivax sp.]
MTDPTSLVVGGFFALAFVFGAVAHRTNFCTMGALSDVVNMGHWGRLHMWLLAVAVAVLGTAVLAATGTVAIGKAVTMQPTLRWLSLAVGGLLFGVGMTLAGGCVNRNLVRLGGGSLRSFVVLTFVAIAGYMTLKGLFGQWRASWLDPVALSLGERGWPDQGLATALARASGLAPALAWGIAAAAVGGALLVFTLRDARFRAHRWQLAGGLIIGALVVAGWWLSGVVGYGENPQTLEDGFFATNSRLLESLSFVGPMAYGLELLLLWTDRSLHLSLGIATVLGVVAGSAAYALAAGRFRWEGFGSLADLRDQLIGAVLMGFGGVTALGCTIGQGLTGLSTLAIGSFIAVAGIVGGSVATLQFLNWREARRPD